MSESSGRTGAPWALRGLVVASVLCRCWCSPVVAGCLARHRARGDASLRSALAVSEEQATRVFDTHVLLGGTGQRPARRSGDDAVIARERELHDRLAGDDRGLQPGDRDRGDRRGRTRAGGDIAVPGGSRVSFSDREYFVALRDIAVRRSTIGGIVFGRLTHADVFTVAVRRGNDPTAFRRCHPGRRVADLFQQIRQRPVRRRHRLQRAVVARGRHAARRLSRTDAS